MSETTTNFYRLIIHAEGDPSNVSIDMRIEGPLDLPDIVTKLAAKKRAPRSDRGQLRKKSHQPELPQQ